jgi:hypothetical protein
MGSLSGGGLRALLRLRSEGLRHCCSMVDWNPADFRPKKAVVLTKVSRYEFEKMQHEKLSETELEEMLTKEMRDSFACVVYPSNQCWGCGSGSACFWASQIQIRIH